jgi:hypothetical protein
MSKYMDVLEIVSNRYDVPNEMVIELLEEMRHLKAGHDEMVSRNKLLRGRTDLPLTLRDSYDMFIKRMEGLEIQNKELKVENNRLKRLQDTNYEYASQNNYWVWQGDGTDKPESLVCPIVISPQHLLAIIGEKKNGD